MPKAKKTVRFYSKEEMKVLNPFIRSNQPLSDDSLSEFCSKYDRSMASVKALIYSKRQKNKKLTTKYKVKRSFGKLRSTDDVINLTKGEFNIPIKSWSMSQEDGVFYFNVMF